MITPPDDARLSWHVVSLVWLLPAIADAAGMYLGARMSGAPTPLWWSVARAAPIWGVWVPLTAAIFWLAAHAPIWRALDDDDGPGEIHGVRSCVLSWRGVATHIVASLIAALLHAIVLAAVAYVAAGTRQPPRQLLVMTIEDWLPVSLLLYWMTLGAAVALSRVREAREQERRAVMLEGRLAQAELAVLRAQLEPHFLFNALNTAVSLVRAGEPTAGVDVLTRLADVLRHLLDQVAQETSLADELRLLDSYLGIARARFGTRLTVSLGVPPTLGDAVIPGLALQQLVENALRHGVGRREDGGHVLVDGWTEPRSGSGSPDLLYLRVRDDGPGFREGSPASVDALADAAPTATGGVGLRNLRDRLERLYGARVAGLSLRNRAEGGAEATLWLPLRQPHGPDADAPRRARD